MSDASVFELREVAVHYGPIVAIPGLTLDCPHGAVGLLGPNGAGKSSLIKTLLGLVRPVRGQVTVLGLDPRRQGSKVRSRLGYMPESTGHFPGLTGFENVAYAGQICGMPRGEARRRAHEMLEYAGLGEERYRTTDDYSTGMKQKVKLAAALIHDPDLLLLDEPTNGLDPKARVEILDLIHDLALSKGMDVVLSTHLLEDVEKVCSSILVLAGGELKAAGDLAQLKAQIAGSRVQLQIAGGAQVFLDALAEMGFEAILADPLDPEQCIVTLPDGVEHRRLLEIALDRHCQVRRFLPRRATLEEVFLGSLELRAPNGGQGS